MSKSTWKIIVVTNKDIEKKYLLDEKGALKYPKYKNAKKSLPSNKRSISAQKKSNIPPHPFSVAIISNANHSSNKMPIVLSKVGNSNNFQSFYLPNQDEISKDQTSNTFNDDHQSKICNLNHTTVPKNANPSKHVQNKNTAQQGFILDLLKLDNLSDSNQHDEYEYTEDSNCDDTEAYFDQY